jgi:hypothetical protein
MPFMACKRSELGFPLQICGAIIRPLICSFSDHSVPLRP